MGRTRLAIVALAALAAVTLRGQSPQITIGARPPEFEGDPVKRVIFDAGTSLGMLRDTEYDDSVTTQEVWAAGTANVGGQAFKVTDYHMSLNDSVPGMRLDQTRTGPGGQQRTVEVVSGTFAWNETEPGRDAMPAAASVNERLVQIWTTPIGVVKAFMAAGAAAKVEEVGGETILSFPLPAPVSDVTMTATLRRDPKLFIYWASEPAAQARIKGRKLPLYLPRPELVGTYIVRVQTQLGGTVTETSYSEYGDWNLDDTKGDLMWPRRIVQKQGDATILDLRVTLTNTYNPYVVMRVPESVRGAGSE